MPWTDTHDYGSDVAEQVLDDVPARERLYTFDEVIAMTDALGGLPEDVDEWVEWFEGHVEHMAAGGYIVGRGSDGAKLREP